MSIVHSARIVFVAAFMSVALLAPTIASAIPLGVYESARSDPAKQSRMFHEAYIKALSRTVTQLRSSTFADGKIKTPQRLENDRKFAGAVDALAGHLTDAQSDALIVMIEQYAAAQPKTELEDVIAGFLLTEAKK
ncbi:MAG TPA: hypothetical protein VGM52_17435 [Herbaspirillum sp.]|jgi:hypothetical protein